MAPAVPKDGPVAGRSAKGGLMNSNGNGSAASAAAAAGTGGWVPAGASGPPPKKKRRRTMSPMEAAAEDVLRTSMETLKSESRAYREVTALDDRLELILLRKQQEAREVLRKMPALRPRCLRLYILSQVSGENNEPLASDPDASLHRQPPVKKLRVRVQGKLLADPSGRQHNELQLSHVFRKAEVWLDKTTHRSGLVAEWSKNNNDVVFDGIEFTRKLVLEKDVALKVVLLPEEGRDRCVLSDHLAQFVGSRSEQRSTVYMCFWEYIKRNNLQIDDDRSFIRLDVRLRELFPEAKVRMQPTSQEAYRIRISRLFDLIKSNLRPALVEIECKLNMMSSDTQQLCYDLAVEVEDKVVRQSAEAAGMFGMPPELVNRMQTLKKEHHELLAEMAVHRRRRDFFEHFYSNPCVFLQHLFLSQSRDLAVVAETTGRQPEEERRSDFYHDKWVYDAVPLYLLLKAKAAGSLRKPPTTAKDARGTRR